MVSTLQVDLNLYLPEPPRKILLKKCIFTFSDNVTNYALIVGAKNVNDERKKICSSIHLKESHIVHENVKK